MVVDFPHHKGSHLHLYYFSESLGVDFHILSAVLYEHRPVCICYGTDAMQHTLYSPAVCNFPVGSKTISVVMLRCQSENQA